MDAGTTTADALGRCEDVALDESLESVLAELASIRADMVAESAQRRLAEVHPNHRDSAQNLLHYLALRRRDLRPLQMRLVSLGLSSLGRAEPHALAAVDAVLDVLHRLTGRTWQPTTPERPAVDLATGQRLLAQHAEALLGPSVRGRGARIMVTMPSEAAEDFALVENLLKQGMDCMRINCAHDGPEARARMIEHLRRAEAAQGRTCRVAMDLGGPKLRTGPLEPGPQVARVRPRRDDFGRVLAPTRVWLTGDQAPAPPPSHADAVLPVPAAWLAGLKRGQRLRFVDARQSRRTLTVVDATPSGCWAEGQRTTYLVPGTLLRAMPRGTDEMPQEAAVGSLPPLENFISLAPADLLVVTRDSLPGRPATRDAAGRLLTPATIGCTIPEVFEDVRSGDAIWFDDGKIGGLVERVEPRQVLVRITQTRPGGSKLRADKGINLPESKLSLSALSAKDLEDLPFVAEHADVVELSFANQASDVELLQHHLAELGGRRPAIVLKIETRRGFENLPEMLLAAMRSPCCGVMIARGDLAIECGFERLAEIQEEILWICEAAHVPVIWATQVLETLAKQGMPSRAEITDAAMSHRAECVMLNKGPHVVAAVRVLDDILRRMQAHQAKKRSMLRELRLAHGLPRE